VENIISENKVLASIKIRKNKRDPLYNNFWPRQQEIFLYVRGLKTLLRKICIIRGRSVSISDGLRSLGEIDFLDVDKGGGYVIITTYYFKETIK